ncbi:MAG: Fe-S oxidoreductase [Gammaproteobacteria bacterium]|nr:Fe-S oxidoreductase [Gammaproteobacteria bacterium]
MADNSPGEGGLKAAQRHAIDWQGEEFHDEPALITEMERVFDVCHGCRRCFNLCNAFPTLFDAVDATDMGEVEEVPKTVYWEVVEHCYLCDLCFMTKCPYVPPHPWNIDFPHLMLRAKAKHFRDEGAPLRDRLLSATDAVGNLAGLPGVSGIVNAVNNTGVGRAALKATLGVATDAPIPRYESLTARKRLSRRGHGSPAERSGKTETTSGRVILFMTCYGNRNLPSMCEDLVAIYEHNGIEVRMTLDERCCGMPKLELGDLESVAQAKEFNVPRLATWVREGYDIVAPIPSCVLMFKQELPLMFPDDEEVKLVAEAFRDPFDYLIDRHKAGKLRTDFKGQLGKVAYHVPCHQRVQNIGRKTREVLELVPGTEFELIERCSGHDGTYGVKERFRKHSLKIAAPVVKRVRDSGAQHLTSDCPMAGAQIAGQLAEDIYAHPLGLLRQAYGI